MKRKVKKFSEGNRVYDKEDEGLLGAKIKYREDEEGRKYTAGRANPMDRNPQEQRYYSVDDIKGKLSGLFGGSSEDSKSFSKFRDLESVGGDSRRPRTIEEQIGRKAEPKANAGETSGKGLPGNKTDRMSVVSKEDAPYEVEKAEPKTSGGGSSNKSSVAKTSSSASKAAENKYKPNEERKSKPYPKDARPLKPVSKAEEDAEGERGKRMEEEAAAQMKKNKSVVIKQKDDDSTDKIIDKTVKDTSGAKTVYSDKPFSFTQNLQDKKDKEKKGSSADDRYKTYKETNAKYQKMLDDYKNKKDDDSKVSGPGGRMIEKNVREFKGPSVGYTSTKTGRNFTDEEAYKRMKDANKANLRAEETEKQRTFKERAEAAKAEADKAEKKAAKAAKKEGPKAKTTMGKSAGSKFDMDDPYSATLGGDLDPKGLMRKSSSRNRLSGDIERKKTGGAIKKMAKGGSASSRADGIAMRGKTRGRIY